MLYSRERQQHHQRIKNIIGFFFCIFFITWNVHTGKVRESRRWLKCIHTHTHTHTQVTVQFFCEISLPFYFVLPGLKSSLIYVIFQIPNTILWIAPPTYVLHMNTPPSMPPTQLTQNFCRGYMSVLFTLGNRCTSCWFSALLACLPCNLHSTSAEEILVLFTLGNSSFSCYATHAIWVVCQKGSSSQYSMHTVYIYHHVD